MARESKGHIVEQCEGCCLPDIMTGTCTAFSDPKYQWRNDRCWGRCGDPAEMVTRLESIAVYAKRQNDYHAARTFQTEAEGWRETANLMVTAPA